MADTLNDGEREYYTTEAEAMKRVDELNGLGIACRYRYWRNVDYSPAWCTDEAAKLAAEDEAPAVRGELWSVEKKVQLYTDPEDPDTLRFPDLDPTVKEPTAKIPARKG